MIARLPLPQTGTGRFVRFLAVGVMNTGVGYGVYAGLIALGLSAQPALALSFVLGVLWNFATHSGLVFGSRGMARVLPYCGAYGLIYLVNALALHLALGLGLSAYLAQAMLLLPMAVLSYVLISMVLTRRLPPAGDTLNSGRD